MYRTFFKRAIDICVSVLALILLSPLFLAIAIAIYIDDRGHVIFRQKRVGANGSEFEMLKFRSMPEDTVEVESAMAHELEITRVGRFLRRTNLDELPQLINVLSGDMSLVGPRPPLPSQRLLCEMRQKNGAIKCLPGITGLAQVKGYDEMPDAEKAHLDGEYASSMSLGMDLQIVLKTVGYLRKPPPVY